MAALALVVVLALVQEPLAVPLLKKC